MATVGRTDHRKPYATETAQSVEIQYPSAADNSGENLTVVAAVTGELPGTLDPYSASFQFPYEGVHHDVVTAVTMTATDSSGNAATCSFYVRVVDLEPPVIDCYADLRIDTATTDSGKLYGTPADGLDGLMQIPPVRENSGEHINVTVWVVSEPGANTSGYVAGDVTVPVTAGGSTEVVTSLLDLNLDGVLDSPLRDTSRFPYSGREGRNLTTLIYRAIDSSGMVSTCYTTVKVADCKGFASSVGCDEPGGAQQRTPARVALGGRVNREAFRRAMLATLTAADTSGTLELSVVVTAYVQTVQAALTLPGTVATFDATTADGVAARLQFRTGVAATLSLEVDFVAITGVSDSAGGGRRRVQTGDVQVNYTAVAGDDVAANYDNATFTDTLVNGINGAGSVIAVTSTDVTLTDPTVATDVAFEVITNITDTSDTATDPTAVVGGVLADPSGLVTELSNDGVTIAGATAEAVSANNCTSSTTVANSDKTILTPCVGSVAETCSYNCDAGHTAFGLQICLPDGSFAGGLCAPAGKVPYRCGTTGTIRYVDSVAVQPSPTPYAASGSTIKRFQTNPPAPVPEACASWV